MLAHQGHGEPAMLQSASSPASPTAPPVAMLAALDIEKLLSSIGIGRRPEMDPSSAALLESAAGVPEDQLRLGSLDVRAVRSMAPGRRAWPARAGGWGLPG